MTRRGRGARRWTWVWLAACAAGWPAAACPLCDSQRANDVRAGLAQDATPTTVLAGLLPFVVLGALVGAIHFSGSTRRSRDARSDPS